MPLKTFRIYTVFLLTLLFLPTVLAQTKTSADVMRERISKAKAQLVVKNYGAAIYELENIRRETNDRTIHQVVNVLLMHSYIEQGDYVRAQKFLKELYNSKKPSAKKDYFAVAGQVVSGANSKLKRYKTLGLRVSDAKLPPYATSDINNMRKTLEMIIQQSKLLSKTAIWKANSLALLEESSNARSSFAKDIYDAKRWKDEVADVREQIANSGSKVINAVGDQSIDSSEADIVAINVPKKDPAKSEKVNNPPEENSNVAVNTEKSETVAENKTPKEDPSKKKEANKPKLIEDRPVKIIESTKEPLRDKTVAENTDKPAVNDKKLDEENKPKEEIKEESKTPLSNDVAEIVKTSATKENVDNSLPMEVDSLVGYATKRVNPVYPKQAQTMRVTGVVMVEIEVNEAGNVSKVGKIRGPALLKRAARDAVKKWQFKPFTRNGESVAAKGFVNFNFSLPGVRNNNSTVAKNKSKKKKKKKEKTFEQKNESVPPAKNIAKNDEKKEKTKPAKKTEAPKSNDVANNDNKVEDGSPVSIGSLVGYATKRVNPVYPRQAKTMRMRGVVKVEIEVDENGKVAKVGKTSGPSLLRRAARDAVRKWKFTPFKRDGEPVKATGFVSFNFNL